MSNDTYRWLHREHEHLYLAALHAGDTDRCWSEIHILARLENDYDEQDTVPDNTDAAW